MTVKYIEDSFWGRPSRKLLRYPSELQPPRDNSTLEDEGCRKREGFGGARCATLQ
jgi:hypothetical protein